MADIVAGPSSFLIGKTLYCIIYNTTGQVWKTTTSAFVTYADADRADYAIAMSPGASDTARFTCAIPALPGTVAAPVMYQPVVFIQAGASPAITDGMWEPYILYWNGTDVITELTIYNQIAALSASGVTLTSPVLQDGSIQIIQGDSYTTANGRALVWSVPTASIPSMAGATVSFALQTAQAFNALGFTNPVLSVTGSISTSGASTLFTVELTSAQTQALAPQNGQGCPSYRYQVRVLLSSGELYTIEEGNVTLTKRVIA